MLDEKMMLVSQFSRREILTLVKMRYNIVVSLPHVILLILDFTIWVRLAQLSTLITNTQRNGYDVKFTEN